MLNDWVVCIDARFFYPRFVGLLFFAGPGCHYAALLFGATRVRAVFDLVPVFSPAFAPRHFPPADDAGLAGKRCFVAFEAHGENTLAKGVVVVVRVGSVVAAPQLHRYILIGVGNALNAQERRSLLHFQ